MYLELKLNFNYQRFLEDYIFLLWLFRTLYFWFHNLNFDIGKKFKDLILRPILLFWYEHFHFQARIYKSSPRWGNASVSWSHKEGRFSDRIWHWIPHVLDSWQKGPDQKGAPPLSYRVLINLFKTSEAGLYWTNWLFLISISARCELELFL